MTLFTGDEYFPGGLATHTVPEGALEFEYGPTEDIQLQWARYYDAADEAGLSRLYGGIHPTVDDLPGRVIGAQIGKAAFARAQAYFDGSILPESPCPPSALIGELIAQVEQSGLPRRQAMLSSLLSAKASIQRGNPDSATGQLNAFANKVEARMRSEDVSLAAPWMQSAEEIIAAIGSVKPRGPAGGIRSLARSADGKVKLKVHGQPGKSYILEASTDLVNWTRLCLIRPGTSGGCDYEDSAAGVHHQRFYRVRQP
jgi:hypothetical protein